MAETNVTIIDGGITSAKGFTAAGLRAGIREGKTNKDMAMIYSEVPCTVAGTFTRNLVKAAPVKWDSDVVYKEKKAQAVVVNSGIANAATGLPGLEDCNTEAEAVAEALGVKKEQVLIGSTGVIGFRLPMDRVVYGIGELKKNLARGRKADDDAATAILTTDTHKKEIAVTFTVGGVTATMGAMCKGSGMIHPNMGTMLGYITTDAAIAYDVLLPTMKDVIEKTFNMVSVDGDTSTNDTVLVLANGMANNAVIDKEGEDLESFKAALTTVCEYLAKNIAKDGEGATRLFTATVNGAPDYETAKILAKSIITSSLSKAAIYGRDANWGRFFCAMGYSGASFEPDKTDIVIKSSVGEMVLVENGMAVNFSEEKALEILSPDEVTVVCDIKSGNETATAWGCDLTYEYVKINADYRS